ncbi:MAG: hypothetical protein WCI19_13490, partial [Betaproteobacteria bacterium]
DVIRQHAFGQFQLQPMRVSAALVTLARTPNLALYEQRYRDDLLGTRRLAQPGGASVESMHSDFRHCPTSVP